MFGPVATLNKVFVSDSAPGLMQLLDVEQDSPSSTTGKAKVIGPALDADQTELDEWTHTNVCMAPFADAFVASDGTTLSGEDCKSVEGVQVVTVTADKSTQANGQPYFIPGIQLVRGKTISYCVFPDDNP